MNITMSDGRTVTLHSCDVQGSYFGQMEGRPGEFINNCILERLREDFSSFHIIEPTLHRSDHSLTIDLSLGVVQQWGVGHPMGLVVNVKHVCSLLSSLG